MLAQTLEKPFVFLFLLVCVFNFPTEIRNIYLYLEGVLIVNFTLVTWNLIINYDSILLLPVSQCNIVLKNLMD